MSEGYLKTASKVGWAMATALTLSHCGPTARVTENYSGERSTNNVVLDRVEKHRGGWGRSECLMCHNALLNLHRNVGSTVDADAIVQTVQATGDSSYCMVCHGNNGTK